MNTSTMATPTIREDNDSDPDSCSSSSFTAGGIDSSRRTSWLSSSFAGSRRSSISLFSPSASIPTTPTAHHHRQSHNNKPHKANQAAWEAMAKLRRFSGRPVGLEHFRLLRRLGSGDIGSVYLCQIRRSPSPPMLATTATAAQPCFYAMKVVDKEAVAVKKKLGRAEMEKEILGMVDHPFCPTLYAAFEASHYSCLVMEYCPGGDLYAARLRQPSKRFSVSAARFYAAETLLALEYLHMMGIVYRDLKPENVLIRDDGHIMLSDFDLCFKCDVVPQFFSRKILNRDSDDNYDDGGGGRNRRRGCSTPSCTATPLHPVISCFSPASSRRRNVITTTIRENVAGDSSEGRDSVSRTLSRSRSTRGFNDCFERCPEVVAEPIDARSKSFVGTHEYLAPEVISGQGHGNAVDWWTFGIFLYEMLFGMTPFKGENNEKTLMNILKKPMSFPRVVVNSSKEYEEMVKAQDLMSKLLVKNPRKRVGTLQGSIEIKRHEFFNGINWALIRSIKPPWIPRDKTNHPKIRSHNHGVNYYLPPKIMTRKERDEPYHLSNNHFDYF